MKEKKKTEEKEILNEIPIVEEEVQKEVENGKKNGDEVENLQEKCEELNDKNLRLMAEFDNYRKRTLKEKADLIKHAGERIFTDILPLVDDFERALGAMENSDDNSALKEGVDLIYNKFIGFLASNGVKPIPTENEVFDVDLHEAITTFPTEDEKMKGKIIDCTTKGYTLNEKVIRFSKVVVGE
jgi:molecular chaperone GrpE